jgi:hypothetical protein
VQKQKNKKMEVIMGFWESLFGSSELRAKQASCNHSFITRKLGNYATNLSKDGTKEVCLECGYEKCNHDWKQGDYDSKINGYRNVCKRCGEVEYRYVDWS